MRRTMGRWQPPPRLGTRSRSAAAWWWSARPSTTSGRRSRCCCSPTSTPGRRLAADGLGGARARAVRRPWTVLARGRPRRAPAGRRPRRRPRGHERRLLPRPRPAAARDRRRHRVPRRHRAGGVRRAHPRNACALALAVAGVALLTQVRLAGTPVGLLLAAANCLGFVLYVVIGHRLANVRRSAAAPPWTGSASSWRSARSPPRRSASAPALPGGPPPDLAALGARRRHLLDGDPLPHRPARDGPAAPRDVQPHARAAAGHRHGVRHRRCCTSCPAARTWSASRWSSRASPPTEHRTPPRRRPT